jgi:hypothetical protein
MSTRTDALVSQQETGKITASIISVTSGCHPALSSSTVSELRRLSQSPSLSVDAGGSGSGRRRRQQQWRSNLRMGLGLPSRAARAASDLRGRSLIAGVLRTAAGPHPIHHTCYPHARARPRAARPTRGRAAGDVEGFEPAELTDLAAPPRISF